MDTQENIKNIIFIAIRKSIKSNNQKLAKIHNQVYKSWKIKHRSKFSLLNY